MNLATLEGRLSVRLGTGGATLCFTPPLPAARLFRGRRTPEVLALLPTLYAVCGRAHLAAAATAMEAVRGQTLRPQQQLARATVVAAEALREHLLRILTGWGAALDQPAHPVIISEVMGLPERVEGAFGSDWSIFAAAAPAPARAPAPVLANVDTLLERQILGCSAAQWLALDSVDAALAARGSRALGPRFLQWLVDSDHAAAGAACLSALPAFTRDWLVERFAPDTETPPGRPPEWDGRPCETGAFARRREHPLVAACGARWGHGLLARSVARLVEVAELVMQLHGADPEPARSVADGATGFGIVETARGRLAHRVSLDGERVAHMQILAPTDWNCHPRGVLAACLRTLPRDEHARQRAALVVECIDPCVGYVIEVDGHA